MAAAVPYRRTPSLSVEAKLRLAPRDHDRPIAAVLATMTAGERRAFYLGAMLVDGSITVADATVAWDHHRATQAAAAQRARAAAKAEADAARASARERDARLAARAQAAAHAAAIAAAADALAGDPAARVCVECHRPFTIARRPGRPPTRCDACKAGRAQVA